MAIAASTVLPTNSLEDFRIEFNNLVSDVSGITATNVFTENIIFEGATADAYETTLAVTDPTADRTLTLPNATDTIVGRATTDTLTNKTLTSPALNSATVGTSIVPSSADGATLGTAALEWSDLFLADGAVINFGDDQDVTLTHVADAGLLLNTSMYLTFRDAALKIHSSADGQLDIDADTEVEITATTVDLNGNLDVSGTYTGGGLMTTGGNIVIPNDGNIGSVGDTDAIAISSAGVVTFSQTPIFSGDSTFSDDISLSSDSAVINFGADSDITLTHAADTSLTVGGAGGTTGMIINNTATDGDPFLAFSLSGTQTFTMGVDDGDSDKFKIGTTAIGTSTAFSMDSSGNVAITGDLTVTGDDITMTTNTSGAALIADGTNFNPVVISGDATIATNGALTIAANAVEGSMLNTNVISGQTALTSAVASTDELLISDAGTIKRVDVSLITDLATGDATALAIALG